MVMVTNFPSKKAWDSGSDNILEDFYKPALIHAKRYRRGQRQNNDRYGIQSIVPGTESFCGDSYALCVILMELYRLAMLEEHIMMKE